MPSSPLPYWMRYFLHKLCTSGFSCFYRFHTGYHTEIKDFSHKNKQFINWHDRLPGFSSNVSIFYFQSGKRGNPHRLSSFPLYVLYLKAASCDIPVVTAASEYLLCQSISEILPSFLCCNLHLSDSGQLLLWCQNLSYCHHHLSATFEFFHPLSPSLYIEMICFLNYSIVRTHFNSQYLYHIHYNS